MGLWPGLGLSLGSGRLEETGGGVPGRGPQSSKQAQSRAGSCSRRGAGSGASTPPPPAVMSAGPLLKGQAARGGSDGGWEPWTPDGGTAAVLRKTVGSPSIQLDRVPETQER